jgi:ferrous iron transport protein B
MTLIAAAEAVSQAELPLTGAIALVGHPNVGKSALFHLLTGQRVTVSNYPGTTVEVARGALRALPGAILVDTPGVVAFPPQSEDEQVTARVLLDEPLQAVLQVGDAKNLRRTLGLTLQIAEMGLPMTLALNMMDEAGARGVVVDLPELSRRLGLPVTPTTAVRRQGIPELIAALRTSRRAPLTLSYPAAIEAAIAALQPLLPPAPITARALALALLSADPVAHTWLAARLTPTAAAEIQQLITAACGATEAPAVLIGRTRQAAVEDLVRATLLHPGAGWESFSARLGRLTTDPFWGVPIVLAVLYGLYWFVGVFGAGTLVGLLENDLFGGVINPLVTRLIQIILPFPFLQDLVVGEYGLWTMGITYAFALIFPIVTTFFLAFGILEDSGYLPRLAALSNRAFAALGLNGKAVLPMVLGLGCVTMATLTTRVMESKRERLLVTLLLALAVPCSAQLGVVMGMLAGVSLTATLIWGTILLGVLLAVGWLAARVVPGERTPLLVELPPLRLPVLSNVVVKTLARLEWYLKEVVPLFLLGSLILFTLDKTGLLVVIARLGEPLVSGWLGLPPEAATSFLIGFLRRDFGATGLFIMRAQGLLDARQVVVSMVTITLFVPCLASLMMIAKERGGRTAWGMIAVIMPLAFLIGGLLNRLLLLVHFGG